MKRFSYFLLLFISFNAYAQNIINELTYENTQNIEYFEKIQNGTEVLKYIASDGSVLKKGDTLIIGIPTASISHTTVVGGGSTIGVGKAKTQTISNFSTIMMGKPLGFGNVMNVLSVEPSTTASQSYQGQIVIINEMTVYHKGSKKKPLALTVLLGEQNGRAFGIYKFMSTTDFENSLLIGEIKTKNSPMTRDEAIAKLKESKELLDIGLLEQEEYNKIKEELSPIIMGKK